MTNCLFCRIANGEIPVDVVYGDDFIVVFRDIAPAAPEHVLAIPKQHFDNIEQLSAETELTAHLLNKLSTVARQIAPEGFRIVFNTDVDGGQTVFHVHAHALGGRSMQWPPG